MAIIHLIDGEKGGVGKSLFCRVLIEYFWRHGRKDQVGIVDADRNLPLLGRTYAPALYPSGVLTSDTEEVIAPLWSRALDPARFRWLYFSDSDEILYQLDDLFNLAVEYPIILNLPSNVYQQVTKWFVNNDLLTVGAEVGVKFWKWFVTTGEEESRSFLKTSLTQFGDKLQHIIVKNYGLNECELNWSGFESDSDLKLYLGAVQAQLITMPKLQLSQGRYDAIKEACQTFSYVIGEKSPYPVLERARVKRFLEQSWQQLDAIKIPCLVDTTSSETIDGDFKTNQPENKHNSPESKSNSPVNNSNSTLSNHKLDQSDASATQIPENADNQQIKRKSSQNIDLGIVTTAS